MAQKLIAEHGAERVIDLLAPFVTEPRQQRIETVLANRMDGIHVAIEEPSDRHNAAVVVRSAEALGLLNVHVVGAAAGALRGKRTTQGAFHWIRTRHHDRFGDFLSEVRSCGLKLCGAWMDAPLPLTELPAQERLCLIFGNESRGLSRAAREACDLGYRIPMYGMSESFNLAVSAALSLYEVLERRRRVVGQSDLGADGRQRLRALYYLGSVDRRLALGILKHP